MKCYFFFYLTSCLIIKLLLHFDIPVRLSSTILSCFTKMKKNVACFCCN